MAKKFVRTTSNIWDNKTNKSEYNDSIVFIENTRLIWSNGIYYNSNSDTDIPSTSTDLVPLTITVNDPINGLYVWTYDGTDDPSVFIDLTNASSGGGGIYETVEMSSVIEGLTFTRTETGWMLDSDYIGHTVYIPTTLDADNWNNKQDLLVSGTNIKTINNLSLLGSGNIEISAGGSSSDTKNTVGTTVIEEVTDYRIPIVKITDASSGTGYALSYYNNKLRFLIADIEGNGTKSFYLNLDGSLNCDGLLVGNSKWLTGEGLVLEKQEITNSSSVSVALNPFVYYKYNNTISSLSITSLTAPSNTSSSSYATLAASYIIEFKPSTSSMSLSLPSSIKWMNGDRPTVFDTSATYQISIVENLATYQKFK